MIANKKTAPANVDHPPLLNPVTSAGAATDAQPPAPSESYRWEPDKSPLGPVSMVISGYDKRVIVLRNGVEIGRSSITLKDPEKLLGTHAFVKMQGEAEDSPSLSWIGLGITGHMDDANRPPDPDAINRIRMPDAFVHQLMPLLGAGSTLMITDEPVLESTTGVNLAILSSSPEHVSNIPAT